MAQGEAGRRLFGPMMPQVWLKELRRKGEIFAVQLRKERRNEAAQRRRMGDRERRELEQIDLPKELISEFPRLEEAEGEERLEILKEVLQMTDLEPAAYLSALTVLRQSLSHSSTPPVHTLTQAGFIPLLTQYIDLNSYSSELVLEATWALCNLAAGPKPTADLIVASGSIDKLISVIDQGYEELSETAIWALGNLAEDGALYRDLVLSCGGHLPLLSILLESSDLSNSLSRVISWTLSALTKGQPAVSIAIVKALLPGLQELAALVDHETQIDVLQTLGNVTCWETEYCELVTGAGLLRYAAAFLPASEGDFLLPALRVVGNVAACSVWMTQEILDLNILDRLEPLISHENVAIRKQVLWTLSNIAAGSTAQIQLFLTHSLNWRLLQCFEDSNYFVRKETVWVVGNLLRKGTQEQCARLICADFISTLAKILREDVNLAQKGVEILQKLLEVGEQRPSSLPNPAAQLIEATGCLRVLEQLCTHSNSHLSESSSALLQGYFEWEQAG